MNTPNYYEFLQISPHAEPATIHRVFQFLAARYHPDNAQTGDVEKFMLLKQAYEVLSNPERRAEYDATYEQQAPRIVPLSAEIDFMDSLKGELNRRLGLMALLYIQRRTNTYSPQVPLNEVEERMGFPRDYLEFTVWYLQRKGYITRADNSDFALTAEGVDFVETQREHIPILDKLLTTGAESPASAAENNPSTLRYSYDSAPPAVERTTGHAETNTRRAGATERRVNKNGRRTDGPERRANP